MSSTRGSARNINLTRNITTRFLGGNRPESGSLHRQAALHRQDAPVDARKSALQHRLNELLLFELMKDGQTEYHHFTLRALYNHVLTAITAKPEGGRPNVIANAAVGLASTRMIKAARQRSSRKASVGGVDEMTPDKKVQTSKETPADGTGGVTYRERLGGYLHPRDMRRLVTPFSVTNEPELIVRRHCMLLNFDPLRAIVLRDRLLVLVPDGADSILIDLEKRVRGGLHEFEHSIFGDASERAEEASKLSERAEEISKEVSKEAEKESVGETVLHYIQKKAGNPLPRPKKSASCSDLKGLGEDEEETETDLEDLDEDLDEWEELNERKWIDLPFELQCVDAVLQCVVSLMSSDVTEVQSEAYDVIESVLNTSRSRVASDTSQDSLRCLKNTVGEMATRVQGFVRAMSLLLDEDEDMALMNLSRLLTNPERFIQPVPIEVLHEESDEPELILEAFLQQGLSNANVLDLLKGMIATTEELLSQKLDSIRNRLLYVDLIVSLVSLMVAAASLVGSFLGMNLINHLEDDANAFRQVVIFTLVAAAVVLIFLVFFVFRVIGTLPNHA